WRVRALLRILDVFLLYVCLSACSFSASLSFFFFQAEDGIRDRNVTGVQTCALPIYRGSGRCRRYATHTGPRSAAPDANTSSVPRSEERRVGKECRSRWAAEH